MNQDFMDPEIFADFIIEAREHLESIEPNLLELEKLLIICRCWLVHIQTHALA